MLKGPYINYKEIQAEITRRKNMLLRANYEETQYREEMNKLRNEEKVFLYKIK